MTEAELTTMRLCAVRVLLGAMLVLAGSSASAQTPAVTVYFGDSAYSVNEGGSVAVQVQLSADPERPLTIPLEATPGAGAGTDDFMAPDPVTFASGETSKSATFTTTEDTEDDDDETVELGFGALPDSVSEGSPGAAIVTIADNDDPAVTVSFGAATSTVTEGWTVDVLVTLDADLFTPIDETPPSGPLDASTLRSRVVTIDLGQLDRAQAAVADPPGQPTHTRDTSPRTDKRSTAPAPGTTLTLNLFDDTVVTGLVEYTEPTFSGGYAVSGHLVEEPLGTMTLVVNGETVAGTVRLLGETYRIRSVGDGQATISEVEEPPLNCGVDALHAAPDHQH